MRGAFCKILTLKSSDSGAEFIQGVNFEWGYFYKLKIKSHKLKILPQDGSKTDNIPIKINSRTKVPDDYQFKMMLDMKRYPDLVDTFANFKTINDSTYNYFDKIEIEVASTLKNAFKKSIIKELERYGSFVFISPAKVKLIKLD